MADPTKAWDLVVRASNPDTLAQNLRDALQAKEAAGFVATEVTPIEMVEQGLPVPAVLVHLVHQDYLQGAGGLTLDLASIVAAKGASMVGVCDAAGRLAAATVEAALLELDQRTVEALYTNDADSSATVAGNTEQFFDKTYTLPAGKLNVGDFLEIDFAVLEHGSQAGGGNITIQGYVGTQVVYTSGAVAAVQNHYASGKLRVKIRAAAGSVVEEDATRGAPGTAVPTHKQTTGLTLDPAVQQLVRFSSTFVQNNAGNICKLTDLTVRAGHIA